MLLSSAIYAYQSFQKKKKKILPEITTPMLLSNAIYACQSFQTLKKYKNHIIITYFFIIMLVIALTNVNKHASDSLDTLFS